MELTVLGSSGGCPAPGNPASGYLVGMGDTTIWSDAGPGTFMRLMDLTDPGSLDAVVISHVHPDHCADLVALYGYLAYGPSGRVPMPVYLPEGASEPLAAFVRAGDEHVFFRVLDFRTVGPGDAVDLGEVRLTFAATNHPVPTVATRFEAGGASLAYSADTGPGGGFPALAAGADVVLVEATTDGERTPQSYPYHLNGFEAGAIGAEAGGRLVLTHVSPTVDPEVVATQAATSYGSKPDLATPGLVVAV